MGEMKFPEGIEDEEGTKLSAAIELARVEAEGEDVRRAMAAEQELGRQIEAERRANAPPLLPFGPMPEVNASYVKYDNWGSIIAGGSQHKETVMNNIAAGQPIISGHEYGFHMHKTHYVDVASKEVREKSGLTPYTVAGTVISGLPVPAWVAIDDRDNLVEDGIAELEFLASGVYPITVRSVAHFPVSFDLEIPDED